MVTESDLALLTAPRSSPAADLAEWPPARRAYAARPAGVPWHGAARIAGAGRAPVHNDLTPTERTGV